MNIIRIEQRLEAILKYMEPFWEFVNCHMINFLTDQHWERHIPEELRQEVPNMESVKMCIQTVFWQKGVTAADNSDFSAFSGFVNASQQHRLGNFEELSQSKEELYKILGTQQLYSLSIKEFMSAKKRHEVEIVAALVDELTRKCLRTQSTETFIVDAGDGKGYLSSRLALQYRHRVLGIDCNEINTENAIQRSLKLQRAWLGLKERAELEKNGVEPLRRSQKHRQKQLMSDNIKNVAPNMENYKTSSRFISSELNMVHLIQEKFILPKEEEKPISICLTGLHTCGNLAPTCLKVFHAKPECKILCNIGCCYHLLKEANSGPEFFGNKAIMDMQTEAGFPMSDFLKNKHIKLGRNARMLASQSIERTIENKELPNISLFYRALLEILVCENNADLKNSVQVGKIRKFNDFQEYIKQCNSKAQLNLDKITPERLYEIELQYDDNKHYLHLFYLLRMQFAPVLESIILLDRLLYLKELNYDQSFLISLFDAVISPRHFAIVAIKNT